MIFFLLACEPNTGDDSSTDRVRASDSGADSGETSTGVLVQPWVSLPYSREGEPPTTGTLSIQNVGGPATTPLTYTLSGPFAVEGDLARLRPDEAREWSLTGTFSSDEPAIHEGRLEIGVNGTTLAVGLSAVVGSLDLPNADWTTDDWGTYTVAKLPSAPFPHQGASYTDSSVLVALPLGYSDSGRLGVVAHLHGHNATLSEILADQFLREQFAISGRNAVFIVPQGPKEAADSDFGALDESEGFSALLRDSMSILYRDGLLERPHHDRVALTSHSGGYSATANIVVQGGEPIHAVHLFDSLYARETDFKTFVLAGGVFRSNYTSGGGTDDNNAGLLASLEREGQTVDRELSDLSLHENPVSIGWTGASHGDCVSDDRVFARWLAASGLPARPTAPAELLATRLNGAETTALWRVDAAGAREFSVKYQDESKEWTEAGPYSTGTAAFTGSPLRVHLQSIDSSSGTPETSDEYGATGGDWLIVDGFDRVLDGSWTLPQHDFAATLGVALDAGFSVASNEAVADGVVDLGDYERVLWMLGDESTADTTFTETEQSLISAYLSGGGELIASGSELAYATEEDWLDTALHCSLAADNAGTLSVNGWTVGDAYDEDYPDALYGDDVIWEWQTGQAAAVGWRNRVVVVGFGLENLSFDEMSAALGELGAYLAG